LSVNSFNCNVGGRALTIQTGKLAGQATRSVTVSYGETVVLVALGVAEKIREGIDFLPLTVEYEERLYAAGKIPGGFIRREGRPSQEATLASRLSDRPIRPLLPKTWRREIQIVNTVLSADQENDPDILAIVGASACLSMSSVPFAGPVGAVRVGYINDELVLNPTMAQLDASELDLVVVSTRDQICMVEAGCKEVSEELVLQALDFGFKANLEIIALQDHLQRELGSPKEPVPAQEFPEGLEEGAGPLLSGKLEAALFIRDKVERDRTISHLIDDVSSQLGEGFSKDKVSEFVDEEVHRLLRKSVLEHGRRVNGRAIDELRHISCEAGILPRTHGSGLFNRGLTQVLSITTLGSTREEQQIDGIGIEETKRYMHHYNMPPFATGEVKRLSSPGRREIGHGALAERALRAVIPDEQAFPYTIRVVSEVLSSNGSTSMGSTCASSLSLMDAGVPIKAPVAGISIGLVTGDDGRFVTLTDIEGIEDHHGDMDFKVAGTREGITAIQLDIKLTGIPRAVFEEAFQRAKDARFKILDVIAATIAAPRAEVSRYAPRMYKLKIDPDKIGAVIGSGGKTIRTITEETKTTIDIEQDGTVVIGSTDEASAKKAIEIIEGLTKDIEVGTIYTGKVTRILSFGALVEILPGKEGMVHISELAPYRVNTVEDIVKVGDEVTVKVIRVEEGGKIGLSRKAVFEPENAGGENAPASPAHRAPPHHGPPQGDRGPRPYGQRSNSGDRKPFHRE